MNGNTWSRAVHQDAYPRTPDHAVPEVDFLPGVAL